MTAQISDSFEYKGKEYSLAALSAPIPFAPQQYGLEPHSSSAAPARAGFYFAYTRRFRSSPAVAAFARWVERDGALGERRSYALNSATRAVAASDGKSLR